MDLLHLIDNDKSHYVYIKDFNRVMKFENYFKQIPVPFKIYAGFECNLKSVKCKEGSYTEKFQDHIACGLAYETVCIDHRFSKPTIIYRDENTAYEFIKAILQA